jgi:HlyD family secretion protein
LSARPTLGDNIRVEVSIVVWESPDELVAPLGALFRDGDRWATFVVDSGRARLRHVDIGERSSSHAQITGGLSEGERVIVFPSDKVDEGVRVRER